MSRRILSLMVVGGMLLIPTLALTQEAPQRGEGRRGGGDPAQFRERMMNNIKEQLAASDDEWTVLTPKIEKVMTAQREARTGFGGFTGFGGRGGPGARGGRDRGDDNQPQSKVAQAQRALREALDSPGAEIGARLAAYRKARDEARAELQAAQKELKELVTPTQEARLVLMNLLD